MVFAYFIWNLPRQARRRCAGGFFLSFFFFFPFGRSDLAAEVKSLNSKTNKTTFM